MENSRIRKVFPGGNTAYGFYSFYDQIIPEDARRILIIKGGPGVGKSSFMRAIAEALLQEGWDVEFHCCSSDNNSLDGLVVPEAGVALIDGTAPHVLDPRNPGAVDEIIHLGDHWNEAGLRASREAILELNRQVAYLFARAYNYLAQAKLLVEEAESYYQHSAAVDQIGLHRLQHELVTEIFGHQRQDMAPGARHLFASAITPAGCVNYLESIFGRVGKRYVVEGGSKEARAEVVERLYREAANRGFWAEVFHCALLPDHLEHLLLPELDVALITSTQQHSYAPAANDAVVDLDLLVNRQALASWPKDLAEAQVRFQAALDRAVNFLHRAKNTHDEMETYYQAHMHFDQIDARREEVLSRVLEYCQEARNEGRS